MTLGRVTSRVMGVAWGAGALPTSNGKEWQRLLAGGSTGGVVLRDCGPQPRVRCRGRPFHVLQPERRSPRAGRLLWRRPRGSPRPNAPQIISINQPSGARRPGIIRQRSHFAQHTRTNWAIELIKILLRGAPEFDCVAIAHRASTSGYAATSSAYSARTSDSGTRGVRSASAARAARMSSAASSASTAAAPAVATSTGTTAATG